MIPAFVVALACSGTCGAATPHNRESERAKPRRAGAETPRAALTPVAGVPGLSFSGQLRAYDFNRENRIQNAANPNRSAFNFGGYLHLDYDIAHTPLHVATTYFGAYPFGANGVRPQKNGQVDNTLPGFALSTFGEAYLRYADAHTNATVGDQIITTPWALTSDTRIKPAVFQGLDAKYTFGSNLGIGVSRMIRFENRTSSAFERNTILTSSPAGGTAYPPVDTAGFLLADLTYKNGGVTASANHYSFYDIANLFYAEGRANYAPGSPLRPFVGIQYANERQTGRAVLGRIANDTYGALAGLNVGRNVVFALGVDTMPVRYADVTAHSLGSASKGFFLPAGGTTGAAALGNGAYRLAYGGIASPYTESYTSDPLFTTSISQGMVERQSPGTSYKASLTFSSDTKRVRAILSEAYYDYGNALAANRTYETDVDVTYYFAPVPAGTYKGLSFRERFADRQQPTIPFDFKYIRTQLQYDF